MEAVHAAFVAGDGEKLSKLLKTVLSLKHDNIDESIKCLQDAFHWFETPGFVDMVYTEWEELPFSNFKYNQLDALIQRLAKLRSNYVIQTHGHFKKKDANVTVFKECPKHCTEIILNQPIVDYLVQKISSYCNGLSLQPSTRNCFEIAVQTNCVDAVKQMLQNSIDSVVNPVVDSVVNRRRWWRARWRGRVNPVDDPVVDLFNSYDNINNCQSVEMIMLLMNYQTFHFPTQDISKLLYQKMLDAVSDDNIGILEAWQCWPGTAQFLNKLAIEAVAHARVNTLQYLLSKGAILIEKDLNNVEVGEKRLHSMSAYFDWNIGFFKYNVKQIKHLDMLTRDMIQMWGFLLSSKIITMKSFELNMQRTYSDVKLQAGGRIIIRHHPWFTTKLYDVFSLTAQLASTSQLATPFASVPNYFDLLSQLFANIATLDRELFSSVVLHIIRMQPAYRTFQWYMGFFNKSQTKIVTWLQSVCTDVFRNDEVRQFLRLVDQRNGYLELVHQLATLPNMIEKALQKAESFTPEIKTEWFDAEMGIVANQLEKTKMALQTLCQSFQPAEAMKPFDPNGPVCSKTLDTVFKMAMEMDRMEGPKEYNRIVNTVDNMAVVQEQPQQHQPQQHQPQSRWSFPIVNIGQLNWLNDC